MKSPLAVAAFLLAAWGGPGWAQRGPDGYVCSAETIFGIGGMDAEGVGEIMVRTDPDYRETGARFSYKVRERLFGRGRMDATWALPDAKSGAMGPIESLWLPFWTHLLDLPSVIEVSLDGAPPTSTPIADKTWLQIDRDGTVSGLRLSAKAGAAPELRGHRSFAYRVKSAGGLVMAGETFLLPDWKEASRRISWGLKEARAKLRTKRCGRFIILSRPFEPGKP